MERDNMLPYLLAGNCTFTLKSTKLDKRYTYKIQQDKVNASRYFVKVMYGSDNERDYRFLGWFYTDDLLVRQSSKSCEVGGKAYLMIRTFLQYFELDVALPPTCLFYPSGKCAMCGRTLTTPESVELGIGPECRKKC